MDNSKKFSIEYLIELLQKVSNIEKCNSEIHNHTYNVDHRTAFRFALCTQSTYLNDEYYWLGHKQLDGTIVEQSGYGTRCKVEIISQSDLIRARGFKPIEDS